VTTSSQAEMMTKMKMKNQAIAKCPKTFSTTKTRTNSFHSHHESIWQAARLDKLRWLSSTGTKASENVECEIPDTCQPQLQQADNHN
jgi:hypothetical protein